LRAPKRPNLNRVKHCNSNDKYNIFFKKKETSLIKKLLGAKHPQVPLPTLSL